MDSKDRVNESKESMGTKSFAVAILLKSFILFLQHTWGTVQHPYGTYRKLAAGNFPLQTMFLFLLCLAYFGWTTLIHVGLRGHPLIISFNFFKVTAVSAATFVLVLGVIRVIGGMVGGKGSLKTLFLPWSYSLLPTLIWFFATSLLWLLFPPPRTLALSGKALSFAFLVFSWFLFFWKGVLYYLTLRFGMKLDLIKIILVSAIIFPLGFLYSLLMYKLGIFRVPFL